MAEGNINTESKGVKRKHGELEVDSLDEPLSTVSVHSVISSGSMSDGKSKVRVVGFSPSQRTKMQGLMEKKQAVVLDDCEVRRSRRGKKMDSVLKGSTKVTESRKKFDFSNIIFEEEVTRLSDLETKGACNRVTVRVKVTQVSETTIVPTGKKKQDIAVI